MADKWMDERDREWRERDWRRSEAYGRGEEERGEAREAGRWDEERSWRAEEGEPDEEQGRRRAYDEEFDYRGRPGLAGGGAYGGEGFGRGGGRPQAHRAGPRRHRHGGQASRFTSQDDAGRSYADESGREDYGYRSRESYGGWPEWREEGRAREREGEGAYAGRGGPRPWASRHEYERRYGEDRNAAAARAGEDERGRWEERREEGRGREGAGDFLQRAGERIGSWFRGGREEERHEPPWRREDFGRELRPVEPGQRGRGPKGYQRSDERISDEVHQRLTDDPWLDASEMQVEVKEGEVTLSGHVDNRESKHRAERLIEDVSGVRHVQNNLRVEPNAPFTGAGRGFGSGALEAEMRRGEHAREGGGAGQAGAEPPTGRSAGTAAEGSVDPKTGEKRT